MGVIPVLKIAAGPLAEKLFNNSDYKIPQEDLNKLWERNHIRLLPNEIKQETKDTMEQFEKSITYNEMTTHYSVCLPCKENKAQQSNNLNLCLGTLRSL